MNIYKNESGKTFFHFDLYRITSVDDFLFAGFDEYLIAPNSMCLIEWPEVIEPLLKLQHKKVCKISIDYVDNDKRILKY
jgi:tRNA threonylcarbamoyladenosine biosynthesis protein TsaE